MRRRTALSMLLLGAFDLAVARNKAAMKEFAVHFPNHLLKFALPEEMVSWVPPAGVPDYFDPAEHLFTRGFQTLFTTMVDFNGPFWMGARGSLFVNSDVSQLEPEYRERVDSIEALEKYLGWWVRDERAIWRINRIDLNGTPVLVRSAGDSLQIVTMPLDENLFLQFSLRIDHVAGKSSNWLKRAQSMRDAIKTSISLTRK